MTYKVLLVFVGEKRSDVANTLVELMNLLKEEVFAVLAEVEPYRPHAIAKHLSMEKAQEWASALQQVGAGVQIVPSRET